MVHFLSLQVSKRASFGNNLITRRKIETGLDTYASMLIVTITSTPGVSKAKVFKVEVGKAEVFKVEVDEVEVFEAETFEALALIISAA